MSKITRKQIVNTLSTAWGMPYGAVSDPIMALIEQRETEWEHTADLQKQTYDDEVELLKAQYTELVEAVNYAHKIQLEPPDVEKAMLALAAIFKAHREIMSPPQSPADRLNALADSQPRGCSLRKELLAIAAELREAGNDISQG